MQKMNSIPKIGKLWCCNKQPILPSISSAIGYTNIGGTTRSCAHYCLCHLCPPRCGFQDYWRSRFECQTKRSQNLHIGQDWFWVWSGSGIRGRGWRLLPKMWYVTTHFGQCCHLPRHLVRHPTTAYILCHAVNDPCVTCADMIANNVCGWPAKWSSPPLHWQMGLFWPLWWLWSLQW